MNVIDEDLARRIRQATRGAFSDDELRVRDTVTTTGETRRAISTDSNRTLLEIGPGGQLHTGGLSQSRFPGDSVPRDADPEGTGRITSVPLREHMARPGIEKEKRALHEALGGLEPLGRIIKRM